MALTMTQSLAGATAGAHLGLGLGWLGSVGCGEGRGSQACHVGSTAQADDGMTVGCVCDERWQRWKKGPEGQEEGERFPKGVRSKA